MLDEVIADGVRRRIALVPGWQTPVAFTLVGLLAAGGLSRAAARSRRRGGSGADVADLVLPLAGLVLLLVPFLPGLPDRWPMVQVLAGPAKWIVWAVVAGQCLWIALPHVAALRRWVERTPDRRAHRGGLAGDRGRGGAGRLASHPHRRSFRRATSRTTW